MGIKKDENIVGTITRLEPVKGNRYLIYAWKQIHQQKPDAKLLIVGDGSERNFLEDLASKLGIKSSIIFAGLRHDLPELISIMEFLVLPSINEGMGKVLIQAAAMGKPSIGSNICGIPDIIKDGKTGLLVPAANPEELADAIVTLLNKTSMIKSFGESSKQWVFEKVDGLSRFSKELMIHKLDVLYRELIKDNSI